MSAIITDQAGLNRFVQELRDSWNDVRLEVLLYDESERLDKQYKSYFNSGTGPGGKWAPNAPATIKAKGHGKVLFGKPREGFRLSKSLSTPKGEFSIRYDKDSWPAPSVLIHGTSAPYSVYNDQGTKRIPARPHIGINSQYFQALADRAVSYVFEAIKKLNL